jgi:CDP-diacylglycerol--glycerol-3-phosphate 3-phosphatidyltransferase
MALVIIGRELAVTGLRGVALSMGVVVGASPLGKAKTVAQYVAITVLILERGVPDELAPFHLFSEFLLWLTLGLTVLSGVDYFYRFFVGAGAKALVKEDRERWP